MRRRSIVLAVLCLTSMFALSADAQSRGRRTPRAFFTVSDGIGVASGGTISAGTGLSQTMRVGGVVRVVGNHGLDLSAVRIQMIIPAGGQFSDQDFRDPSGDAIFLSYAGLNTPRGGGFPAAFTVGGGAIRRRTGNADTRESWAARIGFDGESLWELREWADANVSAHLIVMPGRDDSQMYTATISLGFRIG
jgi:hypothetical protein